MFVVSDLNESSLCDLFEEYATNPNILMVGTTVATGMRYLYQTRVPET